jgi:hypothetical protein
VGKTYNRKNVYRLIVFLNVRENRRGQSRIDNPETQSANIGYQNGDNILYILKNLRNQ